MMNAVRSASLKCVTVALFVSKNAVQREINDKYVLNYFICL